MNLNGNKELLFVFFIFLILSYLCVYFLPPYKVYLEGLVQKNEL